MAQIFRIAHPLIITPEGVPAGPYNGWSYIGPCYCPTGGPRIGCLSCPAYLAMDAVVSLPWYLTPPPSADGLGAMSPGQEHSGFASLEQLLDWFGPVLDTLSKCGFVIYIYNVPERDVRHGRQQVVFPAQRASVEDFMPC